MNLSRLLLASTIAAGPVGMAVPANAADPHALGNDIPEAEDGESATWTVSPCADPDDDHCVFVQSTGSGKRAPWAGNAYWTVGSWILFVNQPDAILCGGGGSAPGLNNYSWDATNPTGYVSINTLEGDQEPGRRASPFRSPTKTGSGPVQYPTAPVYTEPVVPPPHRSPRAPCPGRRTHAGRAGSVDVATPKEIPNYSDPLTEAIVSEPGFNAR